ncbi:hypothetical protein NEMIN01_1138 [Nematocida minor]|uniref:uncharacterized protein n=1 Tax=Nematocida minor TaxID=1912983 RepID=UPI0022209941|nr:uncharacterized protein NEMIN01_1138 [Nematocida minor]KAI5190673.1 hypothetical protein NEMIN01_1138 [Nematocida minor]
MEGGKEALGNKERKEEGYGWSMCINSKMLCVGIGSRLVMYDVKTLEKTKVLETSGENRELRVLDSALNGKNREDKMNSNGDILLADGNSDGITGSSRVGDSDRISDSVKIGSKNKNKSESVGAAAEEEEDENIIFENSKYDAAEGANADSSVVIRRCEFIMDSDIVSIGYFNGVCDIVNIDKNIRLDRLEGDESEIKSVSYGSNRLVFSTREGSVWIWFMNEEGEWEIEEIVEYSESDVKSTIWFKNKLITTGYNDEVVIYSRWEDEICEVKWEIESIFKTESCAWDASAVEIEGTGYIATVTQQGYLHIYSNSSANSSVNGNDLSASGNSSVNSHSDNKADGESGGEKVFREEVSLKVSSYPVISVTNAVYNGVKCFAMVVDRRRLVLYAYGINGLCVLSERTVLTEYEEPMDIVFSEEESAIFILSTSVSNRRKYTHIRKVLLKEMA